MNTNGTFKVGIYLRLSIADVKEGKGESDSISNQRDYIMEYVIKNDLEVVDTYIDDGVSGTQFDREDFQRLLEDIEKKKINMVIAKDTSRLGRNMPQSIYYATEYFPDKNIRFYSVSEDYDSFDKNKDNNKIMIKALFNEMYVEDISKKIKATLTSQKKLGKFMGATEPYGYKKNLPYDKHELIIDEETAPIVQRIFEMAKSGMGLTTICNILTDENIPSPSVYKRKVYKNPKITYGMWQTSTVRDMLRNPTYIGNLAQGKQYKTSYKTKSRRRYNEDEWIIVNGACPAIIDEETFNIVQSMADKNRNHYGKELPYLFRGFIYCKDCGHRMGIDRSKYTKANGEKVEKAYCICSLYKKYSKYHFCSNHKLNYFDLEEAVLKDVRKKCRKYLKTSNFEEILKNNNKILKLQADLENKLSKIKSKLSSQDTYIDKIYKDKLKGIIDEDMFLRQYNLLTQEKSKMKDEKHDLELKLYQLKNKISSKENEQYKNIIETYLKLKKPSRELLSALIDKIVVDKEQNIEIYYNFKPLI